ncbi:MAG: site-2 protease family protein, partial [Polyangia bacterium]|nr:site-2 protease family protein [Polyangia bacterium]
MGFDLVSLVLALLILGFLIAIHELGHMLVAKRAGMRVLRFSVGFGPALWKRTYGETTYQIAAVPFGGFVEIVGMNPLEEQEDPDDPRLYENKSVWARAAVILAGPLTNYIFAFLFAGIVYMSLGTAVRASAEDMAHPLRIEDVVKGGAADKAGLLVGDQVTHVDGYPIKNLNTYYMLLEAHREGYRYEPDEAKRAALRAFKVKVRRAGEDLEVTHRLLDDRKVDEDLALKALPKGAGVLV